MITWTFTKTIWLLVTFAHGEDRLRWRLSIWMDIFTYGRINARSALKRSTKALTGDDTKKHFTRRLQIDINVLIVTSRRTPYSFTINIEESAKMHRCRNVCQTRDVFSATLSNSAVRLQFRGVLHDPLFFQFVILDFQLFAQCSSYNDHAVISLPNRKTFYIFLFYCKLHTEQLTQLLSV